MNSSLGADCPPLLETQPRLSMRFDRRNRLLVPLRFSQAVQFSGTVVVYDRNRRTFAHRVRLRIPASGRVVKVPFEPEAIRVMRSRGCHANVIDSTARDAEGETNQTSPGEPLVLRALRRRRG